MRIVFLLSFFIFFIKVSAQVELSGIVRDSKQATVSFATVQIKVLDKLIAYTTTDSQGSYSLKLADSGNYTLKITHICYLPIEQNLLVDKDSGSVIKNITLEQDTESLEEVILNFEPRVMKVSRDTITYNLKALTNGVENSLADVIDKLPGVVINPSGQISVNGKVIRKLLIDGEELFKKQHRLTAESITSEMIEGIRYLDKFKDFGNINGFENKQMHVLDVSVKEKFKNKITGDIKAQGGYKEKLLGHTNLYRLGGKLKAGFIGDRNTIGKQSITLYEYEQLTKTREADDFSATASVSSTQNDELPRFFDATTDVYNRENTFGAVSLILKPTNTFKASFLNLSSNSDQKQRILIDRLFFENTTLNQKESRNVASNFFVNTSIFELGYQPRTDMFFEYRANLSPQQSKERYHIDALFNQDSIGIVQKKEGKNWRFDQELSFMSKVGNKSLLKISGLAEHSTANNELTVGVSKPFLRFSASDTLKQIQNERMNRYGYELQTVTQFERSKFLFNQGIFTIQDSYGNQSNDFINQGGMLVTNRTDSYLEVGYKGTLNKKLKFSTRLHYRFLFYKRFKQTFEDFFYCRISQ